MKSAASTALLCALALTACDDGKPIVLNSVSTASPSGEWKAVIEEVDNGLGFGQGALYEEVHVVKANEQATTHGDAGQSVVFYAESMYEKGSRINIKWLSANKLQILHDHAQKPGKHLQNYRGITLEVTPNPTVAK